MRAITFGVAVCTLLTVTACATATDTRSSGEPLQALTDIAARRVQLADVVAAAKWGTASSIDDPVREKVVLAGAATKSTQLALDPAISIQVFTDQIEANKAVQYALYSQWSAHPEQAPRTRPDLDGVRPVLDQINDGLLTQLKATRAVRTGPGCTGQLAAARHHTEQARGLDAVHSEALGRALASVCRRGTTG